MALHQENVILLGAGSGIAPFLGFLDQESFFGGGGEIPSWVERPQFRYCQYVFVAREIEQLSWLSQYLSRFAKSVRRKREDWEAKRVRVGLHLYLTKKKGVEKSPSILLKRLRSRSMQNFRQAAEQREEIELGQLEGVE